MKAEAAQTALRAAQRRPAYRPAGRGGVPAAPTPDAAPLRTRERARTGESKRERWKGGLCPSPARPRPRLRRRRGARAGPTRTADPLPAIRFAGAVIKKALPGHPSWGGGRGRGRGDDLAAAPAAPFGRLRSGGGGALPAATSQLPLELRRGAFVPEYAAGGGGGG